MLEVLKMLRHSLENNPHLHLYAVSASPYASPLDVQSKMFGEGGDRIYIVDSFRGRRPFLLNRETLATRADYPLQLLVTLILDSHVASQLHDYRTGRDTAHPGRRAATEEFLAFASRYRVDYNPVFYMTESQAKSAPQKFLGYVTPVLTSILYLHAMDEGHFLITRQIKLKPEAVDHYLNKYGGRTFEECGEIWVHRMMQDRSTHEQALHTKASYVCLLKLVLIHKKSRQSVLKKMEEFEKFLADDLECNMGREAHLACYYLAIWFNDCSPFSVRATSQCEVQPLGDSMGSVAAAPSRIFIESLRASDHESRLRMFGRAGTRAIGAPFLESSGWVYARMTTPL